MSMKCVIVDDEYLAIKVLEEYAVKTEELTVQASFKNPQEALAYLQTNPVDLLFLDIQMPYLDGFELLKQLQSPPLVVFTTARHDYAVHAFELEVLDYLVKPIALDRFQKAVKKAIEYRQYRQLVAEKKQADPQYLMVRSDHRIIKIDFDEIELIEGLGEYVKVHTHDKMHITLAALKDLILQLPHDKFIRIHKSYIIALSSIVSYNHQVVRLKNQKEYPIGRAYKKDFLERKIF